MLTRHPVVAIESAGRRTATEACIRGRRLSFAAQDTQFTATVAAITKNDGQHVFCAGGVHSFRMRPRWRACRTVWYGGVHAMPDAGGMSWCGHMYKAYPTVTVINVAAALETIRQVVVQITYIVQFLAAFSIFAGVVILASSIAGTRYRRSA